jgi:hypothetical protein
MQIISLVIIDLLSSGTGEEEQLREYLFDHPGCSNAATHMLGCMELQLAVSVGDERASKPKT